MSLTLILTRHTKSDWQSGDQADHDRPLNSRGKTAADALGQWMARLPEPPQEALCSTALRTRQTLDGLGRHLPPMRERYLPGLYQASVPEMLMALRTATQPVVLMVGHNPAIAEFAERLLPEPPEHGKFARYPTGATTIIRFSVKEWPKVDYTSGQLVDFIVPRELTDQ
jgi:phosphohistidine phosphatase